MLSPRRCFGLLVAAGIVSSIGTGLTTFALAIEAFQRTGDATWVGLMAAAGMLPMILVTPLGGVLADRHDRRLMMLLGDGGSALALGLVVWRLADPLGTLWQVAAALALSAAFAGLTEPALRATVSDLVPAEELDKASGLLGLTGASRWLVAPALAGALLLLMPVWGVAAIDMATFGFTLAATLATLGVLGVRRPADRRSAWADFRDGLAACRTPGLRQLIAVMCVATFAAGAIQALLSPLMLPFVSAQRLGVITSIAACGMLIGSLLIGVFGVRLTLHHGLALGFVLAGSALALVGVRQQQLLITLSATTFFLVLPLINSSAEVMLRGSVANEQLGRVWGVVGIITQLGAVLAFVTLPPLADAVLTPAMMPGGALAGSLGAIFGTGPGRGIGLLICLSGLVLAALGGVVLGSRSLNQLSARIRSLTAAKETAP